MTVFEKLNKCAVIPVVVIDDVNDAIPLAKALLDGGIDVMEITCRTQAALEAISLISKECPDVLVGAGTVLNVEQGINVVKAGAKFIVSPGLDADLVKYAQQENLTIIPGAVTPSEIMQAMKLGLDLVKFFPASNYGGLKAIKSLAAPFYAMNFMPTGGVNAENLKEYLACKNIVAVGGSWLCDKKLVQSHNFAAITKLAREARSIADELRK